MWVTNFFKEILWLRLVKQDWLSRIRQLLTPHRVWLIAVFFLLVGWAAINFTHGHRIYALLIIAFYLISLLLPKPSFTLVLVSVIAYMFLSSVSLSAISQIRKTINEAMEHPGIPLTNLLTPHTGLEVLPEPVQQMLALIDENAITSYRLSPQMSEDYHIVQRIVESAWPIRMTDEASSVFTAIDEIADFNTCEWIDQTEEVTLVNCP